MVPDDFSAVLSTVALIALAALLWASSVLLLTPLRQIPASRCII